MPDRDKILSTRDHQVRFINGTNGEVLRSLPISTGKGVVALDAVNKAEDTIRNVTPENSVSKNAFSTFSQIASFIPRWIYCLIKDWYGISF